MSTTRKPIHAARAPKRRRLAVSVRQSADLVKFATMLEVRPQDFLGWILGDVIRDLKEPSHGLLSDWAVDQIAYEHPPQGRYLRVLEKIVGGELIKAAL